MKTSKPFATISYNSNAFLQAKLDDLITQHSIEFYTFVEHYPEDDETKKHKHLFIVPNGRIDTDQVRSYLTEIDPLKPTNKPLGVLPCKPSKFADWYLYALHDTRYLASKGQTRKYHYLQSDFTTSDNDFFVEEIHTIDLSKLNRVEALVNAVENNVPFAELVKVGLVPLQQFVGYEKAYHLLSTAQTYRNGSIGHEEFIDIETGEVEFDPKLALAFDLAFEKEDKK